MKKISVFTFIILSSLILFGQKKSKTEPLIEPLIIKGRLINCPEKTLKIFFEDRNGSLLTDTINLNGNGNFYLKTFKIKLPQRTSIGQNNIQINNIFVAPGYNLTITGDAKDFPTLFKTTKIQGIGAESNQYRAMLNDAMVHEANAKKWYDMDEKELLVYARKTRKTADFIAHLVFDKKTVHDKYLGYFKKMVRVDNESMNLYYLLAHVDMNKYNYEKSVAIVRDNFDNNFLKNIFNDEYFISKDYKTWVMSEYLTYIVKLDYLKDSTLKKLNNYRLEKASKTYTGKAKEYVLYKLITSPIDQTRSFESLNNYKEQFKPYISILSNPFHKRSVYEKIAAKETELLKTGIGKPAPAFTLKNNLAKTYSLADFKGKVVYLDLCASWCGPCRAETPHFKILYNKYKDDNRIAFISVAINDGINEWKKALEQDKPDWIQLLDTEGTVGKAYVASLIPQFIIIDKQGIIVNLDAPAPSSGNGIENMLLKEMEK